MTSVLTLEAVSKKIGSRWIVKDLSMRVEPGEVYGFLGPNGAGKTTTIRMIVGLIRPTSGVVRIDGHDVQKDRAAALRCVGTIVENPETYRYLSGRQNLTQYARLAGLSNPRKRIAEVVNIVGLEDRIDDKVRQYSLGMRQRLGVAQALIGNPKLLVLDEPTNGLDPAGIREFRELMRSLAAQGMSVFVSSHILAELQMMCDRVAIIKSGQIVTENRMEELIDGTVKAVRVRVGDAATAMNALSQKGMNAELVSDKLISVQIDQDEAPKLVRALVAGNVDVFAVEPVKDSLEDTFLELTDESHHGASHAEHAGDERGTRRA